MHPELGLLAGQTTMVNAGQGPEKLLEAFEQARAEGRYNLSRDAAAAHELLALVRELDTMIFGLVQAITESPNGEDIYERTGFDPDWQDELSERVSEWLGPANWPVSARKEGPRSGLNLVPGNNRSGDVECNLETLKAQHPAIQAVLNRVQRDGNRSLPEERAVAALADALQQHEATIAERTTQRDECGRLAAEQAIKVSNLRFDLAAAQATIQQQASKLEQADYALILACDVDRDPNDPYLAEAYRAALARACARAQQAEAKKQGES